MRLFELDWVRFVHFEWLAPALAPASREALLGARARKRFDAEELGADAQLLEREGFLARAGASWRLTPGTPAILRALRFLERVRDELPADNPSLGEALASGASFAPGERAAGERLERALAEAGGALALSQLALVLPEASASERARAIGALLDAGRAHPWWSAHRGRVALRAWPRAAASALAEDCAAPRPRPRWSYAAESAEMQRSSLSPGLQAKPSLRSPCSPGMRIVRSSSAEAEHPRELSSSSACRRA